MKENVHTIELSCQGLFDSSEANCIDCGRKYEQFRMDVVLPHSQWKLIHPEVDGLLCAQCIVNRVSKIDGAIVVHALIEFLPPKKSKNVIWDEQPKFSETYTLSQSDAKYRKDTTYKKPENTTP